MGVIQTSITLRVRSQFFMSRVLQKLLTSLAALIWLVGIASGQETNSVPSNDSLEAQDDEIIVEGKRNWRGHEGMEAFWNGDFETAEIEFEKEFKFLKRRENALYNFSQDAALGLERSAQQAQASQNSTAISGPGGSGAQSQIGGASTPNSGAAGNYSSSNSIGRNILNDGVDTNFDFGFTKYMSGLSELQLGKYDEAKSSFKTAIHYNRSNFDARMRLGLLYVKEGNFEKAAHQLEKIEKQRQKCKKTDCERYAEIREAATTLADGISKTIEKLR